MEVSAAESAAAEVTMINLTKIIMAATTEVVVQVVEMVEIRETAVAVEARLFASSSLVAYLIPPKVGKTSYLIWTLSSFRFILFKAKVQTFLPDIYLCSISLLHI